MNIFLETDDYILEAALDAFTDHRDFPESAPRCEEEDAQQSAAIADFFDYWLTEEVADFYEDGFTAEEDARAVDLSYDFEQLVREVAADARDYASTLAGLPR
jgi:hypothetical protein